MPLPPQHIFWSRWLTAVSVFVVLFGAAMVLAPSITRRLFALLLYSSPDALSGSADPFGAYITLAHGVLGATMAGWGTALIVVVLGPFRRGTRDAWLTLAVSVTAWFSLDTACSLYLGFWRNAAVNIGLAVSFALPLLRTRYMLHNRA